VKDEVSEYDLIREAYKSTRSLHDMVGVNSPFLSLCYSPEVQLWCRSCIHLEAAMSGPLLIPISVVVVVYGAGRA
jgi:hypothetical protein